MHEDYLPEEAAYSLGRELFDWVESIVMAVVCVVVVFTFVARTATVDGDSMLPTLHHKDWLLITRLSLGPDPGDIVVLNGQNRREIPLVKRVIAVEGQTVAVNSETGEVTVDGKTLTERYLNEAGSAPYDMNGPITVPPDHVFVMGDNRNHSWDSRSADLGVVNQNNIVGKVIFRIAPFDRLGLAGGG